MPQPPHPTPPFWLVALAGVLALLPFLVLGDLAGASDRSTAFLRTAGVILTVLALLQWRALHRTFGVNAARVGLLGIGFAGFVAMTLVSRMASFPEAVFALPFLLPAWLVLVLLLASALTVRLTPVSR